MVSIKSRLYISTATGLALTLLVAGAALFGLERYAASVNDVAGDDMAVFQTLGELREENLRHRIFWREVLVAAEVERTGTAMPFGKAESRAAAEQAERDMEKSVTELQAMKPRLDEEDQALIDKIADGVKALLVESRTMGAAVSARGPYMDAARRVVAARDQQLMPVLNKYLEHKNEELTEALKATESLHQTVLKMIIGATLATLLVMLLSAFIISRSIISSLSRAEGSARTMASGDFLRFSNCKDDCSYGKTVNCEREQCEIGQLNISLETMRNSLSSAISSVQNKAQEASGLACDLAAGAKQAAAASENQAEQVQHVAAAIEQLNVSINEIVSAGGNVRQATVESSSKAIAGVSATETMATNMSEIAGQARRSVEAVAELRQSAEGIESFTRTIKEIADQTNLLALNAAIEAARAGEHGRGFAVVADEVRKLAERTGSTTRSIDELAKRITHDVQGTITSIEGIGQMAESGRAAADLSVETLRHIKESAVRVQQVVAEITSASGEQKAAADMSAQSMEKIASAAEENNAVIENVRHSAGEISEIASHLKELTGKFKVKAA